jgi:pre-mRNA-splicing helicase BRR2
MNVFLEREMEDGQSVPPAHAPYFPTTKAEGWWLIVCNAAKKELLAIKRITSQKKSNVKLSFQVEEGEHQLTLYFMCDSYAGCDQEYEFSVKVGAAAADSEEDEGSMEE